MSDIRSPRLFPRLIHRSPYSDKRPAVGDVPRASARRCKALPVTQVPISIVPDMDCEAAARLAR